ncbi:MAG: cbb3-type cytochrome c oxidase subunit II [Verrucomicrobiota bacterium]|nr:cbb3-type cytochrome c oxidase subunit II [Verrucomicrobiota bacterium]
MNQGPLVFLGIFFAFACAWCGMILAPQFQIGQQSQKQIETTGQFYPSAPAGLVNQGREVYRAQGCAACHTRQIRGNHADVPRWGKRITVAQDYLYDQPVMIGAQRIGPDLANAGLRQPAANWHLLHLYNPQLTSKGSIMPPYRYLFEKRKIKKSAQNLGAENVFEIIPKPEAVALIAYLLSLKIETDLFEAPLSTTPPPTNSVQKAEGTNAPGSGRTNLTDQIATNQPATNSAATTNAPAKTNAPPATNSPTK